MGADWSGGWPGPNSPALPAGIHAKIHAHLAFISDLIDSSSPSASTSACLSSSMVCFTLLGHPL